MVDDSELDYIRTLLGTWHATATAKQTSEVKKLRQINDTERILVNSGYVVGTDSGFYIKRYKVKLSEASEATLMAMFNSIVNGCESYNRAPSVSTLCNIRVTDSGDWKENSHSKEFLCELNLEVEWSTS